MLTYLVSAFILFALALAFVICALLLLVGKSPKNDETSIDDFKNQTLAGVRKLE